MKNEKIDPLTPLGRKVFNEVKDRQEASHEAVEETATSHVFVSPEVVELHLQNHTPIPEGTAKLIFAMNLILGEVENDAP
jgi:hypothetical protein